MAGLTLDSDVSRLLVERVVFMLKGLHESEKIAKHGFESTSWRSQLRGFCCALEIIVGHEGTNKILALVHEKTSRNLGESLADELMERAFAQVEQVKLNRSGYLHVVLGQYDKALVEGLTALKQNPTSSRCYAFLIHCYIYLNRLREAQALIEEADLKDIDSGGLHLCSYLLAFLNRDLAGMEKQVAWGMDKPGVEDAMFSLEASTQAFFGRLSAARDFSRRAVNSAEQLGESELAARYQVDVALRAALFGNTIETRPLTESALGLWDDGHIKYRVALALALAGDAANAESLIEDFDTRLAEETVVRYNYLPTLIAQLALCRNDAFKAIEALVPALPYELGDLGKTALYPVLVRGEAFLAAHQGKEAAGEFRKILAHPGITLNGPIGIRGRVGLARAYAVLGDSLKAKMAYQDFLTLWKDADPDIPILTQAKAEYAKLQ